MSWSIGLHSSEQAYTVGFPTTLSILWRLAGDLGAAAPRASFDLRKGARPGGMIAVPSR